MERIGTDVLGDPPAAAFVGGKQVEDEGVWVWRPLTMRRQSEGRVPPPTEDEATGP
jgi:hypothetical protein